MIFLHQDRARYATSHTSKQANLLLLRPHPLGISAHGSLVCCPMLLHCSAITCFEEACMLTEAQLVAQRATLRHLARRHPEWTHLQLAQACGCSLSTVNKWLRRFR